MLLTLYQTLSKKRCQVIYKTDIEVYYSNFSKSGKTILNWVDSLMKQNLLNDIK